MVLLCRVSDVAGQLIADVALIDVAKSKRVGFVSTALPQDHEEAVRSLLAKLSPIDVIPTPPPPAVAPTVVKPPPPHVEEEPIYRRWWFWAAVGVATVAAVAIPVATTSGNDPRPVIHEF
jgi:hypothetical protein